MPTNLVWIGLALSGLICGAGVVGALVLARFASPLASLGFLAGFGGASWLLGKVATETAGPGAQALGFVIVVAGFVGGYALASALLEQTARPAPVAPLPSAGDRGIGLILLAQAEPEEYDLAETTRELGSLAEEEALSIGLAVLPFMLAAQKTRYRAVAGRSPARKQILRIAERLEAALVPATFTRLDVAWCDGGSDTLAETVSAAFESGCERVVVVPLAVGESLEMQRAKARLDRAASGSEPIGVVFASSLAAAESITALLARRIAVGVAGPQTTGVVLAARGEPEVRRSANRSFEEAEIAFTTRLRALVAESGVPQEQIRIAYAEWSEPGVSSEVRHLALLGCERILVSPACFPAETLVTKIDIPMSVKQARIDPMISVVTLSAWGDELEVVEALKQSALAGLAELETADVDR